MGTFKPLTTFFSSLYTISIDYLYMLFVETALLAQSVICLLIKSVEFCSNSPAHREGGWFMELLAQRCPTTQYTGKSCGGESAECTVCLCEFEGGEEVRALQCKHMFHTDCLDRWLRPPERASCPLCRRPALEEEGMMEQWQAEWEYCEAEENWSHVLQSSWWK